MKSVLLLAGCLLIAFGNQIDGSAIATLRRFLPSEGVCRLLQKDKLCPSGVETWYFSNSSETSGCFNATVDTCGGKGNRFQSEDECQQKCIIDYSERKYEARNSLNGYTAEQQHHCWGDCPNPCPGGYDRCHSCACHQGHYLPDPPPHPRPHPPPYPTLPPPSNATCPPVHCPEHCDAELVRDRYGCSSCHCKRTCIGPHCGGGSREICPQVHCPVVCPRSVYSHLHHCCNCRGQGTISRPDCNYRCPPNNCEHGYIEPPYGGCRSCECRHQNHCPNVRSGCHHYCPGGHQRDGHGCETCQCSEARCTNVERCGQNCRYGRYDYRDRNGCDGCHCRKWYEGNGISYYNSGGQQHHHQQQPYYG